MKNKKEKKSGCGLLQKYNAHMDHEYAGQNAMAKATEFAKNHPEVFVVEVIGWGKVCANKSLLVLLPNENEKEYKGTTVQFIPECPDGQGVFFLGQENLDNLMGALQKLHKRAGKNKKKNSAAER